MGVKVISSSRFNGGIAISDKEGIPNSFRFGYGINIHDEPSKITVLPSGSKVIGGNLGDAQTVGGTVLNAQVKWIVSGKPFINAVFAFDSNGVIYQEDSVGNWQVLRQVGQSVGQGMGVYNNYLYYVRNTDIGRYGPLDNSPTFTDGWASGLSVAINNTSQQGFAPALAFGKGIAFGHGSSVAWWDGSTLTGARLVLPPAARVMSFCRIEQYLAIGTTGSNSVLDNDEGFVFMWDGASIQWNFFNTIDQGSNNALVNYRNQPLSINGTNGVISIGMDPFLKVHQLPKLPISSSCQVYPGAVSSWKGRTYIGFAANSTDKNFYRGVYSWGAKNNTYQDALNLDFLISTGNYSSTVQVTACKGLGNNFYIAWQDGNAFGIDKVIASNNPQASARIDFMIFDDNRIPQDKGADTIRVDHSALRTGESISIFTRTNRTDDFTVAKVLHSYSVGDLTPRVTKYKPDPSILRFSEFEYGVGIGCTTTSPEIYGVSFKYDDYRDEEEI